ncbi:cytosol aminopeptidase-like [Drosophila nasuta]|uniref:cytosol aminopeptidase-like n=1 Tax=Drosophila nasuta TaxID=42062 RepID=UPI00295E71CB|nr:cytosol aminopeptidase-like [Drosophila nasuta]
MAKSQATVYSKSALNLFRMSRIASQAPCARYTQMRTKCDSMNGVVIGLYLKSGEKDPQLTSGGEKFDDRVSGKISELVRESGMTGELGKGRMFSNVDKEFSSVAVIGVGPQNAGLDEEENIDLGMENTRIAAAAGARFLQLHGCKIVYVDGMEYPEQAAEGAALAVWRYNTNKLKNKRHSIPKVELYGTEGVDAWTRGLFKAESQNLARRLSDTPSNHMTPTIFAQATIDALCPCGVSVEVRTMDWIEAQGLNSFLMVAKGSCEPPVLLEINYVGASPEDKAITLLGKGLTFNSGGLCLKEKNGMDKNRASVSGAATVVAAIRAAAALSLPINVSAVLPLCENMPSGMAVKPGDVITLMNGTTLGVKNTALAGIAMMADPLLYAQSAKKPSTLVDIGTYARGVKFGLGAAATGVWTNRTTLWKQFKKAGSLTGDRMWRMPLWKHFKQLVGPSMTYDLCNQGKGPASSCLGAAVLQSLVNCADFAHIDSKGTGMLCGHGTPLYLLEGRMSGRPTRTIIQFLHQMALK